MTAPGSPGSNEVAVPSMNEWVRTDTQMCMQNAADHPRVSALVTTRVARALSRAARYTTHRAAPSATGYAGLRRVAGSFGDTS